MTMKYITRSCSHGKTTEVLSICSASCLSDSNCSYGAHPYRIGKRRGSKVLFTLAAMAEGPDSAKNLDSKRSEAFEKSKSGSFSLKPGHRRRPSWPLNDFINKPTLQLVSYSVSVCPSFCRIQLLEKKLLETSWLQSKRRSVHVEGIGGLTKLWFSRRCHRWAAPQKSEPTAQESTCRTMSTELSHLSTSC